MKLIILLTILVAISSKRFLVNVEPNDRFCFYEVFDVNQKYSILLINRDGGEFDIDITHLDGKRWKSIFYKHNEGRETSIDAYKIASVATTYSFCMKNYKPNSLELIVYFQAGLQLMEFEMLPDQSDAENLQRQLNWLDNQKQVLAEQAEKLSGMHFVNRQLSNMMGTKMIWFAVIGLIGILGVNFLFYWQLKKTFKQRKLI